MVYNQQHSFKKVKDISEFKEMSLDSMHKRLSEFQKKIEGPKKVKPQTKTTEELRVQSFRQCWRSFY